MRLDRAKKLLHTPHNEIHLAHTTITPAGAHAAIVRYKSLNGGLIRFTLHHRIGGAWWQERHLGIENLTNARALLNAQLDGRVSVDAYPVKWEPLLTLLDLALHTTPSSTLNTQGAS
ncbi:hypothetical protein ABZ470_39835 [Streptosporangium sp. NPDC020072]|uniref:hypothetical protein n=1 Tax=Streptosporangium sp. NPDC020072 TaxID=3154788 RepID=UPI003426D8EA